MKIVFLHGMMFQAQTWSRAAAVLKEDGIEIEFFAQQGKTQEAIEHLRGGQVDCCIAQMFRDMPGYDELVSAAMELPCRIGLGVQAELEFSSFTQEQTREFTRYLQQVSLTNFINGIRFLAAAMGQNIAYDPPAAVQTCGIYHPEQSELFAESATYLGWQKKRQEGLGEDRPLIALLCYYGQIVEQNQAEIDALIFALEDHGIRPLCIVTEGMTESSLPLSERYPWMRVVQEAAPQLLLNLLAGRLLARSEDVELLKKLNLPIVQMLRLYQQSPEQWREDVNGVGSGAQSMVFSLTQPEMAGVIEPTAIAATVSERDPQTGLLIRRYHPLPEQIEHLCLRLLRWLRLQLLANKDKRLTIVLHNNPCKGVEATLGLAAGLDTFASLGLFIQRLREAGYDTGEAPEEGKALLETLLFKKAISEFRWTTTDEIVGKGGVLHYTHEQEYQKILNQLPPYARERIESDWGPFPGEGMVYTDQGRDSLLVTGLKFGNLQIIVQPKRGCYGAKCNGEVCRILHDPHLSPPPHWLVTYAYIRESSDAVLHFGAHGALEFLPGKQVGLSPGCFPEISLGDLPNIYLYIHDIPGEGLVAKRRARAVMVDHLSPVQRPAPAESQSLELESLLDQYQKACLNAEEDRRKKLARQMLPLMQAMGGIEVDFAGSLESREFSQAVDLLARRIARSKRILAPTGPHLLSTAPNTQGIATMLTTILGTPPEGIPNLAEIAAFAPSGSANEHTAVTQVIEQLLRQEDGAPLDQRLARLKSWCTEISSRIDACTQEIPQLLRALDGAFIEPGLSGSLALGKTDTLPTGRNFFTSDIAAMPTRVAWEVGQELADNLLRKYMEDEGAFPESVGISLWSIDAFKSDGEVFSQALALMGMQPIWLTSGRVCGIEPIPLDALTLILNDQSVVSRPRVDVLIQTSSILRDMVPHFADLLDEAAVMAGNLDEPPERNAIRKHTQQQLSELREELGESLSEEALARMASFRVFSSAPGACGTGVGLALDASAWNDEEDLAETYINWSGFAYGSDKVGTGERITGMEAQQVFAKQLKGLNVTYMRQYSPEYDPVDCSCYTGCLGGMSVAAKAVSGKRARIYFADKNTVDDHSVRDFQEDLEASVTSKLLNAHWITDRQEEGYQGAGEVASRVNTLFKWSATTGSVAPWVFDRVVSTYIEDQEKLEWLRRENPYGLEEMTRRLLEAQSRGLWTPAEDILQAVQEAALLIEGDMEEQIGEVREEFQGSKVEVMTAADVEKWQPKWKIERTDR
nr:cobaltochelatase subunit CobN [uncultured Desulfobulbus sp.]